jgi:hypothetical protein
VTWDIGEFRRACGSETSWDVCSVEESMHPLRPQMG